MALKSKDTTIDGIKLHTIALAPRAAAKLQAKLVRLLAPALGNLKGITEADFEKLMERDLSELAPVLATLFAGLNDQMIDTLLSESFASSYAWGPDKKKIEMDSLDRIDEVFEGKTGAMYQALLFVWSTNFGDFSGGAFSKIQAVMRGAKEAKAPNESTSPPSSSKSGGGED